MSTGGSAVKRKKVDEGRDEVISKGTTARSMAAATAAAERAKRKEATSTAADGDLPDAPHTLLDLATLPATAIHRYLVINNLLPPSPLTYDCALFPTPALIEDIDVETRKIVAAKSRRAKQARNEAKSVGRSVNAPVVAAPAPLSSSAGSVGGGKRRRDTADEEDAPLAEARELCFLTAFDDAAMVLGDRLAATAREHWELTADDAKEGELISSFMYAIRNRGKTLR